MLHSSHSVIMPTSWKEHNGANWVKVHTNTVVSSLKICLGMCWMFPSLYSATSQLSKESESVLQNKRSTWCPYWRSTNTFYLVVSFSQTPLTRRALCQDANTFLDSHHRLRPPAAVWSTDTHQPTVSNWNHSRGKQTVWAGCQHHTSGESSQCASQQRS